MRAAFTHNRVPVCGRRAVHYAGLLVQAMYAQRAEFKLLQAEVAVPVPTVIALVDPGVDLLTPAGGRATVVMDGIDVTFRRFAATLRRTPLSFPAPPAPSTVKPALPPDSSPSPWWHRFITLHVTAGVTISNVHAVMEATPPTAMTMSDETPGLEVRGALTQAHERVFFFGMVDGRPMRCILSQTPIRLGRFARVGDTRSRRRRCRR